MLSLCYECCLLYTWWTRHKVHGDVIWPSWHLLGIPEYFQESHWRSMGLSEISRVTWQLCMFIQQLGWSNGLIKALYHWPFVRKPPVISVFPLKKVQKCSKCFHIITSSWFNNCQISNMRRTLPGNKLVNHSDVVGARLSALLQLHLHSRLNTWLQLIGQRQLQQETRIIFKSWDLVHLISESLLYALGWTHKVRSDVSDTVWSFIP